MNRLGWLMAFGFCALLSSCAAPSRQFPTTAPGQLFKGGYVNVRAPNSEGWHLVESSTKGMAFAKLGRAPGETLSAQLSMFDLQPTESPEQFVLLIKAGIDKDTDPKRFNVIESTSDYTSERGYPCVRHHAVLDDKEARTSPTTKEQLLLEARGLYCRHPIRTNAGFAAVYSHRGRGLYPGLADEARDFIQGVQAPSSNP
jgi:hypothetical protein